MNTSTAETCRKPAPDCRWGNAIDTCQHLRTHADLLCSKCAFESKDLMHEWKDEAAGLSFFSK